jgi:hypothetical protein
LTDEEGIAAFDKIMNEGKQLPFEEPVKVENYYVQTHAINDDPDQMESFIMEDSGIPLNMRLL